MSDSAATEPPADTPTGRLIAALRDPERLFTSTELGYLMATAARWAREDRDGEPDPLSYRAGVHAGYLQRLAEENAAAHGVVFDLATSAAHDAVQVHRKRMGVDTRYVRDGDFPGGGEGVPEW